MRLSSLLAGAILAWLSPAFAGVTIHFKGTVADDASVQKVTDAACAEAQKNSWQCKPVLGDEIAQLDGITAKSISKLENSVDFNGVKGVVVLMNEMSEPLYLVFGPSRRIENFVKTQFAGADVHIQAVELLQRIKPFFATLEVIDEGGYWDTKDRSKLEKELAGVDAMMSKIKSERSNVQGPVKRPDGRILDLVGKK